MKVAVILGTRPEIIKMSPVIRELESRGIEYFIIHSGQHYSYNMDRVFFEQLKLPRPNYNIAIGSGSHAEETGKALIGIEKVLLKERPDVVLVQGDTNTTLSGALAAAKLMIKVGHVEAGLRSFDREMPEELNRVLVDHLSDYLFAPTERAEENLLNEGIDKDKVFITGNTIVDAVYQNLNFIEDIGILEKLHLNVNDFFLLTLHRQENVDRKQRLLNIVKGLELVGEEFDIPIIYPIHPRTRRRLKEFEITLPRCVRMIDPIDYLSFLKLESYARLILTDSGGVQEEACILRVPCVTIRYNTERPETLEVGANMLAGAEPEKILEAVKIMLSKKRDWPNPFGDGKAATRIVNTILKDNR